MKDARFPQRIAVARRSASTAQGVVKPSLVADVHGASRLAIGLTVLVADVVETMHHNIARRAGLLGKATLGPTTGITGVVYRSVRGVTHVVGRSIDAVLGALTARLTAAADWPGRDAAVAVLNGVLGDHLEASGNALCIPMQLRLHGEPVTLTRAGLAARLPQARARIVVMLHGLCMSDLSWQRAAHDHGMQLARDLDATTLYLHYNSGRHISTNGAELATLLERMLAEWPVPVRELVLVGHSMGGLVIRSACATASAATMRWLRTLRAIVTIGAPHGGAPLERAGHGLHMLLTASPYTVAFARLARLRSAGITDLRHGFVRDADWMGRDRFARRARAHRPEPIAGGIATFAIAGSLSKRAPERGTARSDGLVPVASALARDPDGTSALGVTRTSIAYGTGHLDLLGSPVVYCTMRRWLAAVLRDEASHASDRCTAGALPPDASPIRR